MDNLKNLLSKFDKDTNSLESQLESTAKHLRSYVKVIKSHIPELQRVLKTENHNYKSIEDINLSPTVTQLMDIFKTLEEEDIQMIEELATLSKQWETSSSWKGKQQDAI